MPDQDCSLPPVQIAIVSIAAMHSRRPLGFRNGSISAAEHEARRRQVLLSKRTPQIRLSEQFHVDRQTRPRRKLAGALFRGGRYVSTPVVEDHTSQWPGSFLKSRTLNAPRSFRALEPGSASRAKTAVAGASHISCGSMVALSRRTRRTKSHCKSRLMRPIRCPGFESSP